MDLKVRRGVSVDREEVEAFFKELRLKTKKRLELQVHRNSSVLMRLERNFLKTRLFVHEAFVHAPEGVLDALVTFVKSGTRDKEASHLLNGFVESIETRKPRKIPLYTKGEVYDLHEVFERVHEEYFDSKLDAKYITWFSPRVGKKRSVTLGLYDDRRSLVKINTLLDSTSCPDYFVDYVVFHELVHAEVPPRFDEQTKRRVIHGSDFHLREKDFKEYKRARAWQKQIFKCEF